MRRLLAASVALALCAVPLTAHATGGGNGCTTARGTANLLSDRGDHVVGSYTQTVVYCWSWIGKPSQYTIDSTKRSATWKIRKNDERCGSEVFGQWDGNPGRGADSIKKWSVKTWDSTLGHDFTWNLFRQTYQDDHHCTFKFYGKQTWRPRVVLRLTLPKPSVVSARAVRPG
ncbi:hypothetical protein ACI2LF_04425 [Kribbella sp. NPDC020789]